eukprot:Pgem_evm2s17819
MSRTKFEDILSYLYLDDFDFQSAQESGNEVIAFEKFIDACTKRWFNGVTAGKYLVIDE